MAIVVLSLKQVAIEFECRDIEASLHVRQKRQLWSVEVGD